MKTSYETLPDEWEPAFSADPEHAAVRNLRAVAVFDAECNDVCWCARQEHADKVAEALNALYCTNPTREELISSLDMAMEIIAREVPPEAFHANLGPDADGDDANAVYLCNRVRELNVTLEKARGIEGMATKISRSLKEMP